MSLPDLKDKKAWLKAKKVKVGDHYEWSFPSSCCGVMQTWLYGEKPLMCPSCGAPYWDKPKHEYHLFLLQDEYFKTKSPDTLLELFKVLLVYARTIVADLLRSSRVNLPNADFDEKCRELAYRVFEFPLQERRINLSFGALLKKIAPGVLFKDIGHDQTVSLNAKGRRPGTEYWEDLIRSRGLLMTEEDHINSPSFQESLQASESLIKAIKDIDEVIYFNFGIVEAITFLSGFTSLMKRKSLKFMGRFYGEYGNQTKANIEKAAQVLRDYTISTEAIA